MADANLKIPSEERIRFNASESIINAVSPRVDISTIPGGHRMVVTDIDGVETADIMDGVKGDTGDAAGFGTVSASVDANVGTPSVTVTSSGPNTAKNFDISFKNLKGVKGDTGAAAGFDTPTASVDGYIGTPSVAVTATGPATAKKFDFAFHNLKGEKGDTGSIESLIVDGTEPEEGAGVSVDGPISELSAEGWAEQFSTTGKNLAPTPTASTVNGITVSVSNDGAITLNGTATAAAFIIANFREPLPIGTYTLSANNEKIDSNIIIRIEEGVDSARMTLTETNKSVTFTTSKERMYWVVRVDTGAALSNFKLRIQLELGSTATEYEPYTGGAPSPSPDYPQEIEVAKGRNLWDESKNVPERVLDGNGNSVSHSSYSHSDYIEVKPRATYYVRNVVGATRMRTACVYDSSKAFLHLVNIAGNDIESGIINTGENAAYIRINCIKSSSNHQLTEGSTPHPYVPYGYVGMEVAHNLTLYSDGYSIDGTGNYGPSPNHKVMSAKLENGLYSLSYDKTTYNGMMRVHAYDTNGKWVKQLTYYSSDKAEQIQLQFTVDSNVHEVRVSFPRVFTNLSIIFTTPIPLPERGWVGSLPDGTADVLHLDGAGKVEWEKNTEEVDLGTIPTYSYLFIGGTQYAIPMPENIKRIAPPNRALTRGDYYSSHFGYHPERTSAGDSILYDMSSDISTRLYAVFDDNITSIADAQQWLSDNDVTVLYPLATPVTESLGYIDLPDIPEGSTVSIPELDALGISYYVDNGAIRKLVEQYKARLEATSFSDMEDAITELAAEVQQNTNRTQLYLGYDTVNGKQMISVFKRNV